MDSDRLSNKSLQEEEIQAMFSIYDSEWQMEDDNSYSMRISNSSCNSVFLRVTLPEAYPLSSPPQYLISAPWMSGNMKNRLVAMLEDIYSENIGNCILYQWVVKIQDFIEENLSQDSSSDDSKDLVDSEDASTSEVPLNIACELIDNLHLQSIDELPPITHGEIIQDKKSVFQGHVAKVVSVDQVKKILSKLKESRKIAIATHNILAYRINIGNKFIQDCDDDGETRAGSLLLHLLQLLDVKDVVVVVSRWYGGIHLGPDRFKDINNAARKALLAGGFIEEVRKSCEYSVSPRLRKSDKRRIK